jgi:hypothetical protein
MCERFTRYNVRSSRREIRRERRTLWIQWALIAGAVVVIVVFGYLLLSGGLG